MRTGIFLGMLGMLLISTLAAQAYRLQFKDVIGATRQYNIRMVQTGQVNFAGVQAPVVSNSTMTAIEKVTAVNNGVATLSYMAKNGSVTMKISNLPGDEEEQTITQPIPDLAISYDRTALGKVSNMHITGQQSSVLDGMFNGPTGQLQVPGQTFTFPDKDLKAGDSWDCTATFPIGENGKLQVQGKYTLVGTKLGDDGNTYLQIDGDIAISVKDMTVKIPMGDQTLAMTINIDMKGKETTLFDEAAGAVAQENMKFSGTTEVTTPGAEGSMKMDSTNEMTMKRAM